MPKPWIWLRIASVVNMLFAVGHGIGHVRTPKRRPSRRGCT